MQTTCRVRLSLRSSHGFGSSANRRKPSHALHASVHFRHPPESGAIYSGLLERSVVGKSTRCGCNECVRKHLSLGDRSAHSSSAEPGPLPDALIDPLMLPEPLPD